MSCVVFLTILMLSLAQCLIELRGLIPVTMCRMCVTMAVKLKLVASEPSLHPLVLCVLVRSCVEWTSVPEGM